MSNAPLYRRLSRVVPLIVFATILRGDVSSRAESGQGWIPPACTGWMDPGFTTLVVTVARLRHASGVEGLLRRIGAISGLAGIPTDKEPPAAPRAGRLEHSFARKTSLAGCAGAGEQSLLVP